MLSRPLMTSPDWWFEAEPVEPFYELQRGPGQILYKEAGQRTQSTWTSDSFTIRAGKWCQILVPERKCFKMHHVESQSDRTMRRIPSSETNYRSRNEGVLRLEKKRPWPRTW